MDGYRVVLSVSVEHDMRRIGKRNIERIMDVIESLSCNPFSHEVQRSWKRLRAGTG